MGQDIQAGQREREKSPQESNCNLFFGDTKEVGCSCVSRYAFWWAINQSPLEWVLAECVRGPGWFRSREPAACLLQRLGWGWQSSATWEVIRKDNKLPLAGSLGL